MGVFARSPEPKEAQAVATAVVAQYRARAGAEASREADSLVAYFEGQLKNGQGELDRMQAELADWVKANPATDREAECVRGFSRAVETRRTVMEPGSTRRCRTRS